jgi:hypothetical protein
MSIARHHAEWLSLVEASGPFLSLQVLLEVFPQGLEAHDPVKFGSLKQAYGEWRETNNNPEIHRAWVLWVLREILQFPDSVLLAGQAIPSGLQVTIAQQGETLQPDLVVALDGKPRLLIQIVPPEQGLENPFKNSRWKASPATRLTELLHATGIRCGLVTNGEQWMLVNAPKGETTGFISWYSNLWTEEKLTLQAFRTLLGVRRFFGVEEEETLEALLERSKNARQEITDRLGYQVREAVEVLVRRLDKIDEDRQRTLLQNISDDRLYEAALFIMMRLVFLFSAEEKGLLLLGDRLYDRYYAVSTLREELREQADRHGEEVLERRHDAWCRLLATFRAVYGGIDHSELQLPAYGGDLFDPDKFPFLEGRSGGNWRRDPARPIPVDNRTVLHLLEALQILRVRVPGGGEEPRRLSFRSLDVEQIGHVYEGLLDRTAVRAGSTVLGLLGAKDKIADVSLDHLESQLERGEENFYEFLKNLTGRSISALKKAREGETELTPYQESRFLVACHNDGDLWRRIKPFHRLLCVDSFENPVIVPKGSIYITEGSNRRETGTHYTPKSLTEEIVKHTLEPLVYGGPIEGKPREEWKLKSAREILKLKICDPAMGSGAFLVQVCRYLGERLVEAWQAAEAEKSTKGVKYIVVTPEGELSRSLPHECIIPEDESERLIVAKRIIAERCIYGVDKNPLAVEMAKLSLWLETLQKNKPFTFLDHALKCGDSLVGATVAQLQGWNLDTDAGETTPVIGVNELQRDLNEAIRLRLEIEKRSVNSSRDREEKAALLFQANARINDLKSRADLLVASYLAPGTKATRESLRKQLLMVASSKRDITESELKLLPDLESLRPFHWELEFPEVFLAPDSPVKQASSLWGFDALVGNPPFIGGSKITGAVGSTYRNYLVEWIAKIKGSADLCAYFFLRARDLIKSGGNCGLVATNTIAQGDTREVGLDQIVAMGDTIYRAVPSRKWEGTASLEVAYVWIHKGQWRGENVLNDKSVQGITPYLSPMSQVTGKPYRLKANEVVLNK